MKHLTALALLLITSTASALELQSFGPGSMNEIRASAEQRIHIVSFWSVDCSACYKEMDLWHALSQQYPQLKITVISTDPPEYRDEVMQVIREKKLSHLQHWQFDHSSAQRLRYEIDPQWYGELPRTYLYQANGESIAASGLLDEKVLRQWLAQSFPTK